MPTSDHRDTIDLVPRDVLPIKLRVVLFSVSRSTADPWPSRAVGALSRYSEYL